MSEITPFLWFDTEAEEAANLYTSVFPNSKILDVTRYSSAGPGAEGTVMTVSFELGGQKFVALNGGPQHKFSEAVSFVVNCQDQDDVDTFWAKLSEGGEEGPCGWAQGQVRSVLADRSDGATQVADGSRRREGSAGDGGDDADEEDPDRRAGAGRGPGVVLRPSR